jgi:GGDEF domain-containing protein
VLALVREPELGNVLTQRLDEEIAAHNATKLRPWTLSMSVGSAWSSPQKPLSFEELLERADSVMYAKKRARGVAR